MSEAYFTIPLLGDKNVLMLPPKNTDESENLRHHFDSIDVNNCGFITLKDLESLLTNVTRHNANTKSFVMKKVYDLDNGRISFEDLTALLQVKNVAPTPDVISPDPRIVEYTLTLEQYRLKSEEEGNYLEAGKALKQLDKLQKKEMERQMKMLQDKCTAQLQQIKMKNKHISVLSEFHHSMQREAQEKPLKWSKELQQWRKRQLFLAIEHNYAEAEKVKKVADRLEESERSSLNRKHEKRTRLKELALLAQHKAEMNALLKRIEAKRRETEKLQDVDTKRLVQRNNNRFRYLEVKLLAEKSKQESSFKKNLLNLVCKSCA